MEKTYHQDSPYFKIEPMALVSSWVAMDDVTLENGCLWVVPGSHKGGALDHSEVWMVCERRDMTGPEAVFDRNINGWVTIPEEIDLPDNQQDRDMIARELLIKFQMSDRNPLVNLRKAYRKF